MGNTLKDGITPTMPAVRILFPGVGKPGTIGSESVKKVRQAARSRPKRQR